MLGSMPAVVAVDPSTLTTLDLVAEYDPTEPDLSREWGPPRYVAAVVRDDTGAVVHGVPMKLEVVDGALGVRLSVSVDGSPAVPISDGIDRVKVGAPAGPLPTATAPPRCGWRRAASSSPSSSRGGRSAPTPSSPPRRASGRDPRTTAAARAHRLVASRRRRCCLCPSLHGSAAASWYLGRSVSEDHRSRREPAQDWIRLAIPGLARRRLGC
jgi:hypothetical protein